MSQTTMDKGGRGRDDESTPERRKKRNGGVAGQRLGVVESKLDREKYSYRWINDVPGRIHALTKEDDWDLVPNDGVKSDGVGLGDAVSQAVGTKPNGDALMAYLARKPKGYFDEDQRQKSDDLERTMQQLRRGNDASGKSQSDYVPDGNKI